LGLESFFDVIVASEEGAGDKSSLAPFRVLSSRSKAEWMECVWFVGDLPHDAPVDELIRLGVIGDGHAWLMGANSGATVTGWRNLNEIEKVLERSVDFG
jgi:FMN phosphatase YigB (HAD superfamily)